MNKNELKVTGEGLTYDDVLLIPAYSEVLPRHVSTETWLTKKIKLNVPLMSAAMDTVTESAMAIAMAREGGIGIIHKNMTIERQAAEVRTVKRAESAIIMEPVTLQANATILEAESIMAEKKVGGIPILNKKKLVGILTQRDIRSVGAKSKSAFVSDVMTPLVGLVTAKIGTDLKKAERILDEHKIKKLPIVNSKGELYGLITYKDIENVKNRPQAAKDNFGRLIVGAAVSPSADLVERVRALNKENVDVICIDTAHGHSKSVIEAVKLLRKKFGRKIQLIAGNIATGAAAEDLIKAGADAIKVGIGPGSICTTRIIAGVGVPQFLAVLQVAKACAGRVSVIADGGIKQTGEIAKAIGAGADVVMMGSMFAGVEEAPGETIIYEGRKFKSYRGMGSVEAMEAGSKDRYFQDAEDDIKKLVPEGVVGRVPFKGTLAEVILQMVGGLRAGMGYCGAKTVAQLKSAKFIKVTAAGIRESHPHDIAITKEAPNYSR